MGKWQTAARAANAGNRHKKTHTSKISNKQRQRTPRRMRKQMNRSKFMRKEEMELVSARKNKRLQQLSFENLKAEIKDELTGSYKTKKKRMSRSERNRYSRENKKLKKIEERQKAKDALLDFSSYKRDIEQDIFSEEDDDMKSEQSEDEKKLKQFENKHAAFSWDTRKVNYDSIHFISFYIHYISHQTYNLYLLCLIIITIIITIIISPNYQFNQHLVIG